jgi:hypothetical protein
MAARTINILLGIWLFISAFAWPHDLAQRTNSWICGVLCVAFALLALRVPRARWLNLILGGWVFVSAFFLGQSHGTLWNNVLVGVAVVLVALTPPERFDVPHRTPQAT